MPYSDPVMDGITVQRAGTRALARGVRTRDIFAGVEAVAGTGTPAVVMTYWNLVEKYGLDAFARDLAAAGGAGVITPDLTPDEADPGSRPPTRTGWTGSSWSRRPPPTSGSPAPSPPAGLGLRHLGDGRDRCADQTSSAAPELVRRIRAADAEAMVGVGLGVSNGGQAAEVTKFADAAIVGSALVSTLLAADDAGTPDDLTALRALVSDLASGVRADDDRA